MSHGSFTESCALGRQSLRQTIVALSGRHRSVDPTRSAPAFGPSTSGGNRYLNLCVEGGSHCDNCLQLRIRLGTEEAADACGILPYLSSQFGLRDSCRLSQAVKCSHDFVHLANLRAGSLVLSSERGVLKPLGKSALVVASVQRLCSHTDRFRHVDHLKLLTGLYRRITSVTNSVTPMPRLSSSVSAS